MSQKNAAARQKQQQQQANRAAQNAVQPAIKLPQAPLYLLKDPQVNKRQEFEFNNKNLENISDSLKNNPPYDEKSMNSKLR